MPDKLLLAGLCCFAQLDCNPHLNRVLAPAFGALEDEPVVAGFGRLCHGEPRPRCAVRTRSIHQRIVPPQTQLGVLQLTLPSTRTPGHQNWLDGGWRRIATGL